VLIGHAISGDSGRGFGAQSAAIAGKPVERVPHDVRAAEGVVSKRLGARYVSGPSRSWVKVKCESWKAANVHRGKLFEGR